MHPYRHGHRGERVDYRDVDQQFIAKGGLIGSLPLIIRMPGPRADIAEAELGLRGEGVVFPSLDIAIVSPIVSAASPVSMV
jgi:hypothetical protein